ncbi:MAG TPA: YoaK family protein [Stellaceae bacterium]|jgi:uncharacterized membrane protein YoaK (UPF0700 family)|nr:YoaK family protein [Stellaceae bacterium]
MPLAFAFAAIAGYADAIGYLRYKAFAGMMTGNTVLMGLAFSQSADRPAVEYAALLAAFFITAAGAFALLRKRCPPAILLVAEAVALLLPEIFRGSWAILLLVVAMGLQNPLAQRFGLPLSTTFITGNLLRFAEGLIGRFVPHRGHNRGGAFAIYGIAWLGYAAGAALGAAGFAALRWPLIVPAASLAYIYWYSCSRGRDKLSTSGL